MSFPAHAVRPIVSKNSMRYNKRHQEVLLNQLPHIYSQPFSWEALIFSIYRVFNDANTSEEMINNEKSSTVLWEEMLFPRLNQNLLLLQISWLIEILFKHIRSLSDNIYKHKEKDKFSNDVLFPWVFFKLHPSLLSPNWLGTAIHVLTFWGVVGKTRSLAFYKKKLNFPSSG